MKSLFIGALAVAFATLPPVPHRAATLAQQSTSTQTFQTMDEAAISLIINSVATFADQGDFATIETLYADEIQIDYTSLWGGDVQTYTPQSLMTAWANVLPGFDQTYHDISNIQVAIVDDSAIATANVIADHYLAADHWQVSGQYEYRLVKQSDRWHITHMTLTVTDEVGDRTLVSLAAENTVMSAVSYLQQQQTQQTVRDLLTSLETKDMETFATLWAEDAVQDMPFSPEGFPKRVEGRDNLLQHYAAWPEISGSANFTDRLVFYPMVDPTMVFAEWHGVVEMIPTGQLYQQRYGGLFQVSDGKIKLFREYYDPIVFAIAFGLNDGDLAD